jgi:hypothetical protein
MFVAFCGADSDECSLGRAEMTIAQAKHKLARMAASQGSQLEPSGTFFYVDQTDKGDDAVVGWGIVPGRRGDFLIVSVPASER